MTFNLKLVMAATFMVVMATNAKADSQYDKCMQEAGSNYDFGICGGAWIAREDAKLNATWKKLYDVAQGQTKKDLLAEQRLWITFRQSACAFYANGDWGREGRVIQAAACQATVIANRTKDLDGYLQSLTKQ